MVKDVIPKDSSVHVCTKTEVVFIFLVLLLVTLFNGHWVTHLLILFHFSSKLGNYMFL